MTVIIYLNSIYYTINMNSNSAKYKSTLKKSYHIYLIFLPFSFYRRACLLFLLSVLFWVFLLVKKCVWKYKYWLIDNNPIKKRGIKNTIGGLTSAIRMAFNSLSSRKLIVTFFVWRNSTLFLRYIKEVIQYI